MTERQLIADLLSALEYHTEQTRPIEFSRVAIQAATEYLRKPEQPAQQEPVAWSERWYGSGPERGWWIVCGRDHIAHLGPSEFAEEAVSKIVAAHNQTRPQAREPLTGLLSIARKHTEGRMVSISFRTVEDAEAFERYAIEAAHGIKE